MSAKSFPEFGEIIEEDSKDSFPEFGEVIEETPNEEFGEIETPSQRKDQEAAEAFKFFGYQPSAETIKPIRHGAGVGLKRLAGGLLGSYGDFLQLLQGIGNKTGLGGLLGASQKQLLPTSEDIGNLFEKLSGEKFNPENLSQEVIGEGSNFLGSILTFGGPLIGEGPNFLKSMWRTMAASFIPGAASVASEKLNLSPGQKAMAVLGTSFLTHRMTGKGLRDIENGLYGQARNLAGKNVVNASQQRQALINLRNELIKGGIEETDKAALAKIEDSLKLFSENGDISVADAMDLARKINVRRGLLFAKDIGRVGVKTARRNLNKVADIVKGTIKRFDNPAFQHFFSEANSLHAGQSETSAIFNWIRNNKTLSGLSYAAMKFLNPKWLSTAGAAGAATQTWKFMKSLGKYPGYRNAYFDIIKRAARQDVRGTASALRRFNKANEKISKKESSREED